MTYQPYTLEQLADIILSQSFIEKLEEEFTNTLQKHTINFYKTNKTLSAYPLLQQIARHQKSLQSFSKGLFKYVPVAMQAKLRDEMEKQYELNMKNYVEDTIRNFQEEIEEALLKMPPDVASYAVEITGENISGFHKSTEVTVLDFWAAWCTPCKRLDPIMSELIETYQGQVAIGKVNVAENEALQSKYQVKALPTIIIFKNGIAQKRITGVKREEIKNGIEALLNAGEENKA